ncbi:MAG: hypothetical protein QG588_173 [Candidatus Poribacteria bacterium]|nr:hypothetical protein [Candidatus Poribacteria bacterium]
MIILNKEEWFRMSGYIPHPGQSFLHASNVRFKVVVSGRRWGKSLLAAKEAEAMILKPQTRGWIVSKTYDLGEKVFREIYNTLIKRFKLETVRKSYSSKSGSMYLEFPWESVVEVKSAEHPDSLMGEGLDWLVFDECASCKSSIWEQYLRPTLSDKNGWAMFITTPRGYNWIYDLWKRGNDPDYPEWESFRFPSWDNPYLSRDDIEEARRTLSKATFEQEYGATFTFSSGQVYKEFDPSIHVIAEDKLRILSSAETREWRRFRSIDFGYENPFVCLYIAVDPEDRVIIYDEYYQRHRTMEQHASFLFEEEQISFRRVTEEWKSKVSASLNRGKISDHVPPSNGRTDQHNGLYEFTTCDPSAASARATLFEKGIVTIAPRSNILQGLELVRRQLRVREDGKPGLYISSKCVNTIKEFSLYSYPETMDTEEPNKENDHAMDSLRYFLIQLNRGYISQKIAVYA